MWGKWVYTFSALNSFSIPSPMCDDSYNHSNAPETEEETQEQGHARQENKDLADISRYLEDDSFKDQTTIKLPTFLLEAKATTRAKRLEKYFYKDLKVERNSLQA